MKHEITTDTKRLINFLSEYLPAIDEKNIPTAINCGGCGFFAYHLSSVLAQMGVYHNIIAVFEEDSRDNYMQIKKCMDEKDMNPKMHLCFDHILTEIGGKYFDAMGVVNRKELDMPVEQVICRELLEPLIDKDHQWNVAFDESTKPDIKKYLYAIPEALSAWKGKGEYKHTVDIEELKPILNDYTKLNDVNFFRAIKFGKIKNVNEKLKKKIFAKWRTDFPFSLFS